MTLAIGLFLEVDASVVQVVVAECARAKETTVAQLRMVFKVNVSNAAVEHFTDFSRSALLRT